MRFTSVYNNDHQLVSKRLLCEMSTQGKHVWNFSTPERQHTKQMLHKLWSTLALMYAVVA